MTRCSKLALDAPAKTGVTKRAAGVLGLRVATVRSLLWQFNGLY